jgi:hypothetical protein
MYIHTKEGTKDRCYRQVFKKLNLLLNTVTTDHEAAFDMIDYPENKF